MSEGIGIATALYNADHKVEALAAYDDLHHPNHRYRYAMTFCGHDEDGSPRWLGLRWDGSCETVRIVGMSIGDTVRHRSDYRVGTVSGFGQHHGVMVDWGSGAPEVVSAMDLIVMATTKTGP